MALRFSPARGAASFVLSSLVRGPIGVAATIAVGTVTPLTPGATPTVANGGTSGAAVLNFGIPTSKTVAVGSTTTGAEGTSAAVSDSGSSSGSIFNFTIPRGAAPATAFAFSTTTTDSDPGNGIVRFNNATPASITTIYFDNLDADGNTITGWLDTFDDSTTSGHKGFLAFTDVTAPATKMVFEVTGSSVVDGGGYRKVTVAWLSGATLFTAPDRLAVIFSRTGDKGADGTVAGPGVSVDSEIALFSGTGGATLKRATGSGLAKLTSGVLSIASAGTDYAAATSGSAILKGNGAGGFSSASAGTDYLAPAAIGVTVQAFDAQLTSNVRQNSQSAAYTTVLADGEKHIFHPSADTTARVWTIDSNANVAYPIGTALTFVNQHSAGVITIAITSDTMRLAGAGTTGSRTLAADGFATAVKVATTEWIISGPGLT